MSERISYVQGECKGVGEEDGRIIPQLLLKDAQPMGVELYMQGGSIKTNVICDLFDPVSKLCKAPEKVGKTSTIVCLYPALNRSEESASRESKILTCTTQGGEVTVDRYKREVTTSLDSTPRHLTDKEYQLLVCLMKNQGELVKKDDLLHEVWGQRRAEEHLDQTLAVHISGLRRKIGKDTIVNISGLGYRFRGADEEFPNKH